MTTTTTTTTIPPTSGIIKRMRKQVCLWWERTGTDEFGNPSFNGPFVIACRWESSNEVVRDEMGEEFVSNATIYPDRPLTPGDYVKLAESGSGSPLDDKDAYRVRRTGDVPKLRNPAIKLYQAWV